MGQGGILSVSRGSRLVGCGSILAALLVACTRVPSPHPERGGGTPDAARTSLSRAAVSGSVPTDPAPITREEAVRRDPRLRMTAAFTPERLAPFIAELPRPEITILISGQTAGWITPCGCMEEAGGGLARRAGYRKALEEAYPGRPVYLVDTGGFASFGNEVRDLMTDAGLEGLRSLRYSAVAIDGKDLGTSVSQFEKTRKALPMPWISANLVFHDNGEPAFKPYTVLTGWTPPGKAAPLRVALLGANNDRTGLFAPGPDGRSMVTTEIEQALPRWIDRAKQESDFEIVVGTFGANLAPRVGAVGAGKVDLIVCGDGTDLLRTPQDSLGVPTYAVGNEGRYLAEIRIYRENGKARAAARVFLLDDRFPSDLDIALRSEAWLDRANETTRRLMNANPPETVSLAPFVGAGACASCHPAEFASWQTTGHARAHDTLKSINRDYTLTCTPCHVTGQGGDPALGGVGFMNPTDTPGLLNVQCEACHGAGSKHVENTGAPYGKLDESTCRVCHTPEQAPGFDFATYWPRIRHGGS